MYKLCLIKTPDFDQSYGHIDNSPRQAPNQYFDTHGGQCHVDVFVFPKPF